MLISEIHEGGLGNCHANFVTVDGDVSHCCFSCLALVKHYRVDTYCVNHISFKIQCIQYVCIHVNDRIITTYIMNTEQR